MTMLRTTAALLLVLTTLVDASVRADQAAAFPKFAETSNLASSRRLLQKSVSVGYSASADFRVPTGGDALPALQKANDAVSGGGTIRIESGTYTLSTQWIITATGLTVSGAGMGSTILQLKDNAPKFRYAGFIRFSGKKDMFFTGFTIDGNKSKQKTTSASAMLKSSITYGRYCFYADGFTNLKFRSVRTQNCQGYGFDPHGIKFNPTIFSNGIDIQNCEAINNGWDGFTIDQINGGIISNNLARGNGRHGFNIVTGTNNVVVSKNTAVNNGFGSAKEKSGNGCGICVNDNFELNTRNVDVLDNDVSKSNKAGVCVLGAVNVKISGNKINGAKYCLHVVQSRTKKVSFTDNSCASTPKKVFLGDGAKSSEVTISGNTGL